MFFRARSLFKLLNDMQLKALIYDLKALIHELRRP